MQGVGQLGLLDPIARSLADQLCAEGALVCTGTRTELRYTLGVGQYMASAGQSDAASRLSSM
jgi:hypothetical protein